MEKEWGGIPWALLCRQQHQTIIVVASGLKLMSQWITVMVLLPSQLAAHNPGERINYHIFTFCLDICGIFYWVIYLCWNLWVFHPNHSISGLGIQKSTETKPLALLNFLTWILWLTVDTGYIRMWHQVFPSIAMDMWGRRFLDQRSSSRILLGPLRHLSISCSNLQKNIIQRS